MIGLIIMIASATFFYKAAEYEHFDYPWMWAVGSIVMYIAGGTAAGAMGINYFGGLLGQGLFFVWMGIWLYLQSRQRTQ